MYSDLIWTFEEFKKDEKIYETMLKLEEHYNFFIVGTDKRDKTDAQRRFLFAILKAVAKEYYDTTEQKVINNLKNDFYTDYLEQTGIPHRTKTASITKMRMFLDWLIKMLAEDFNFILPKEQFEDEYISSYVYACLFREAGTICSVCGKHGSAVIVSEAHTFEKSRIIGLCKEHEEKVIHDTEFLKNEKLYGIKLNKTDFEKLML